MGYNNQEFENEDAEQNIGIVFAIPALVLYFGLHHYSENKLKTDILSIAVSGRIIKVGRIKQVNISSFLFIILKSAGARVQYNSAPPLIYTVREIGIIIAAGVIIIFLIVLAVRLLIRFRKNKTKND